jgi:hypothetical protein
LFRTDTCLFWTEALLRRRGGLSGRVGGSRPGLKEAVGRSRCRSKRLKTRPPQGSQRGPTKCRARVRKEAIRRCRTRRRTHKLATPGTWSLQTSRRCSRTDRRRFTRWRLSRDVRDERRRLRRAGTKQASGVLFKDLLRRTWKSRSHVSKSFKLTACFVVRSHSPGSVNG